MTATDPVTADLTAEVAEVLAAHDWTWAIRDSRTGEGVRIACADAACEWFAERLEPEDDVWSVHRAHVATEVTNAVVAAMRAVGSDG